MKFLYTKQDFKNIFKQPPLFFGVFSLAFVGVICMNLAVIDIRFLYVAWHVFWFYNILQICAFSTYLKNPIEFLANIVFCISSTAGLIFFYLK